MNFDFPDTPNPLVPHEVRDAHGDEISTRAAAGSPRNVVWDENRVSKSQRAAQKGQRPALIWFTGLSGSGKSTLSNALEQRLFALGCHTYRLDGDNLRHGLNRDLGFSAQQRQENIRRVGEAAKLLVDAGLIVTAAFISPFRQDRDMVRQLFAEDEFIEVFVDTPLNVCEARDPKGLYARARRGEIKNFTGISSPYERPLDPELQVIGDSEDIGPTVEYMIKYLFAHYRIANEEK